MVSELIEMAILEKSQNVYRIGMTNFQRNDTNGVHPQYLYKILPELKVAIK